MDTAIEIAVYLALGYAAVGLGFALAFAFRFANDLDDDAREGSLGFRLLIVPGAAALWPVLLKRVANRGTARPVERNAHLDAAREHGA